VQINNVQNEYGERDGRRVGRRSLITESTLNILGAWLAEFRFAKLQQTKDAIDEAREKVNCFFSPADSAADSWVWQRFT